MRKAVCLAALIAGVLTGPARAEQATIDVFKERQGLSYELGAKRVAGYFQRENESCKVTLMMAESLEASPEGYLSPATRMTVVLPPGKTTRLNVAATPGVEIRCGFHAGTLEVWRTPTLAAYLK